MPHSKHSTEQNQRSPKQKPLGARTSFGEVGERTARTGFPPTSSSILLTLLQDGREHLVTTVDESVLMNISLLVIGSG